MILIRDKLPLDMLAGDTININKPTWYIGEKPAGLVGTIARLHVWDKWVQIMLLEQWQGVLMPLMSPVVMLCRNLVII